MKNKSNDPMEGSFDPSKQLAELDRIFAESLEKIDKEGSKDSAWEEVSEKNAKETSSPDIEEQFITLDENKKDRKHKAKNKDNIPSRQEVVIHIPTSEEEEEAQQDEEYLSKEERDRMFEELYHIEPPKKREPNVFKTEFRFLNAAGCLLCIFGIFAYLLFADRESGFINSENRLLATMPTLSAKSYKDGSFAKGVTDYFTDTIPGRETLKRYSAKINDLYGLKDDTKISGNVKTVKKEVLEEPEAKVTTVTANVNIAKEKDTEKTSDDESETQTQQAADTDTDSSEPDETQETTTTTKKPKETTSKEKETTKKIAEPIDDGEVYGSVIVSGSGKDVRAVSAYYGQFEMAEKYASTINKYKEELGDKVNVYNMTIPISSAYYIPPNFEDSVSSQKDNIAVIERNLKDIISVNVYDELESHTDEYIYSRTDHHWQPLGAYYAGKVFAEAAGVDYPALDEYGKYVKEDFCGTMYMYSDYNEDLKNNPDTFTYYKPKNDYTTYYYNTDFTNKQQSELFFDFAEGVNTYSVFLGTDDTLAEIDTDVDNGRTLVIIKDSFGNALAPFMVNSFEKIYVVDFRYFQTNAIEFIDEVGCTDLLFAISASSCATDTHIDTINNDRVQYRTEKADTKKSDKKKD